MEICDALTQSVLEVSSSPLQLSMEVGFTVNKWIRPLHMKKKRENVCICIVARIYCRIAMLCEVKIM